MRGTMEMCCLFCETLALYSFSISLATALLRLLMTLVQWGYDGLSSEFKVGHQFVRR